MYLFVHHPNGSNKIKRDVSRGKNEVYYPSRCLMKNSHFEKPEYERLTEVLSSSCQPDNGGRYYPVEFHTDTFDASVCGFQSWLQDISVKFL